MLCLPNLCQMREGLIPVTYLEILLLCVEFDHCHISQWLYFKLAWNLKFKKKCDEVGMCFWKNKLSLGNYSLKKNKNITYKHRKQTVKSLFLKMSLSASNMHCKVACLRFQLLSHNWQSPNCAAQSTWTNGHRTGWEQSAWLFPCFSAPLLPVSGSQHCTTPRQRALSWPHV